MTIKKHSPSPWVWERIDQDHCIPVHTLKGPQVLCRFWGDDIDPADSTLIAAAPDLLAACKAVKIAMNLHPRDPRWPGEKGDAMRLLNKAIAKAEPEEEA